MKTFTYVAAIALLTAGTAFAQSSGMNSSPNAMQQPAQSQSMSNQDMSGSSMSQDRDSSMPSTAAAPHRVATSHARTGADARENRETAQLNMRQVQGGGVSNAGMTSGGAMGGQTAQTPFDRGSPQTPRAGMLNCTPDRPDCGTQRQNPAIQSSPQQRTNNAAPQ